MNESLVDFVGSSLPKGVPLLRRNVAERHVEIPVHVARDNPGILIPTATGTAYFRITLFEVTPIPRGRRRIFHSFLRDVNVDGVLDILRSPRYSIGHVNSSAWYYKPGKDSKSLGRFDTTLSEDWFRGWAQSESICTRYKIIFRLLIVRYSVFLTYEVRPLKSRIGSLIRISCGLLRRTACPASCGRMPLACPREFYRILFRRKHSGGQ